MGNVLCNQGGGKGKTEKRNSQIRRGESALIESGNPKK